jgi:membrane associated rhomboid family serine protease
MLIPIGTVGRTNFRPYTTFGLILLNVIVFILQITVNMQGETATMNFLGKYALAVCNIEGASFINTTRNALITMFLHGSILHILFNMVFLWVFGPRVEAWFGHRRFLMFYILVGLMASLAHVLFGGIRCPVGQVGADIMIGASGAIAGVMGGFLFLFPGQRVRTFAIFRVVNLPALLYLGVWVAQDLFSIWQGSQSNVAHWAHVGGFFAGIGILFIVTMFVPAPRGNPLQHLDD